MIVALVVVVVVMVSLSWGWLAISTYDLRQKNEALRADIIALHKQAADSYVAGYQTGLEASTNLLGGAVTETVGSVTKLLMGEVTGERGVEHGIQTVADQTPDPAWWQWEDNDKPLEDFGVGDSVYVPRDFDDRVAAIGDGESIIPGVPLPDMTGETYDAG